LKKEEARRLGQNEQKTRGMEGQMDGIEWIIRWLGCSSSFRVHPAQPTARLDWIGPIEESKELRLGRGMGHCLLNIWRGKMGSAFGGRMEWALIA
jgi:hypothetical protein